MFEVPGLMHDGIQQRPCSIVKSYDWKEAVNISKRVLLALAKEVAYLSTSALLQASCNEKAYNYS